MHPATAKEAAKDVLAVTGISFLFIVGPLALTVSIPSLSMGNLLFLGPNRPPFHHPLILTIQVVGAMLAYLTRREVVLSSKLRIVKKSVKGSGDVEAPCMINQNVAYEKCPSEEPTTQPQQVRSFWTDCFTSTCCGP